MMTNITNTNKKALKGATEYLAKKTRPTWKINNDITKVEISDTMTDEEKRINMNRLEIELTEAKMKRPV